MATQIGTTQKLAPLGGTWTPQGNCVGEMTPWEMTPRIGTIVDDSL